MIEIRYLLTEQTIADELIKSLLLNLTNRFIEELALEKQQKLNKQ